MSGPWGHPAPACKRVTGPQTSVSQARYHKPGHSIRKALAAIFGLRRGGEERCRCGGILVATGRKASRVRYYCSTCMRNTERIR